MKNISLHPFFLRANHTRFTRHKRLALSTLAMLTLSTLPQVAHAQTMIYDNGTFTPSGGNNITSTASADDFTFASTQTFDQARVWLMDTSLPGNTIEQFSGTLSWFVYTNNAGKPGTVITSGTVSGASITTVDTGVDFSTTVGSFRVFQFDFPVSSTTLTAGTYWFRVKENGLTAPNDGSQVFWLNSGSSTGFGTRADTNPVTPSTWIFNNPTDRAFQLLGSTTAPEPGTMALIAVGGMGFVARLRRRKSSLNA
jgi:PEP-CTERM motif